MILLYINVYANVYAIIKVQYLKKSMKLYHIIKTNNNRLKIGCYFLLQHFNTLKL